MWPTFPVHFQIDLDVIEEWVVSKCHKWMVVAVERRIQIMSPMEAMAALTIQPWIQSNWMCTVCIRSAIPSRAPCKASSSVKAAMDLHTLPGSLSLFQFMHHATTHLIPFDLLHLSRISYMAIFYYCYPNICIWPFSKNVAKRPSNKPK